MFPINPNEYSPPGKSANFSIQRTTAPNGQALLFQSLNDIAQGSFSGIVTDAGFYQALNAWTQKWYPVYLEDDRGNVLQVILTNVQWTRRRRHIDPDNYEYTIQFLEIPE